MVGWLVFWLAACLLPAWPPPSLLCVIETLRPYLPDALAFIAAAIRCFTRPPICYINHSITHVCAFDLLCVFVLIGTTWFQSFSASARVYAILAYLLTCLLAYLLTCLLVWLAVASCASHLSLVCLVVSCCVFSCVSDLVYSLLYSIALLLCCFEFGL